MTSNLTFKFLAGCSRTLEYRPEERMYQLNQRLGGQSSSFDGKSYFVNLLYQASEDARNKCINDTAHKMQKVGDLISDPSRPIYAAPFIERPQTFFGNACEQSIDQTCAICLEELPAVKLGVRLAEQHGIRRIEDKDAFALRCCHIFHAKCIETYCKSKKECPTCRGPADVRRGYSSIQEVDSFCDFSSASSARRRRAESPIEGDADHARRSHTGEE